MWVFLFWNMNLEETLRLHLFHHKVQPSLCWGPVICSSAICLWLPSLVNSVNYFYGKVISKSLRKYFSLFCSHAVVFVLLMMQHLPILTLLLWCVSMRRMSCLKITPYFLLLPLSINLFKIPFFFALPKEETFIMSIEVCHHLSHWG